MTSIQIELTDEEWMSMIASNRDGLPVCCANVSNLRDRIIEVARNGGEISYAWMMVLRDFHWAILDHDIPKESPVMKMLFQILSKNEEAGKMWDEMMKSIDHAASEKEYQHVL